MRSKILLTTLIATLFVIPANASLVTEETTSIDYLQKYGYSDDIIDLVETNKAQVTGREVETISKPDEQKYSKPVRWIRKFFMYLDPAMESEPPLRHNIKMTPSINDL